MGFKKMLPTLLELEEVLDINSPASTSKAMVKVNDSFKLAITQDESRQSRLKLLYSGEGHSLSYNLHSRTFKAKLLKEAGGVKFKISQTVPENKWYLVPNPRVKASTSLLGGRDEMYAKWDFLRRSGKLGDRIYFDLDGGVACKTYVEATSDGTLQYGLRAKVGRGILHSGAARFHSAFGPAYVLKSRLLEQNVRLKATYLPVARRAELEGKFWPTFLTRNLLLTVNTAVPLEEKEGPPTGTVSLKWTF